MQCNQDLTTFFVLKSFLKFLNDFINSATSSQKVIKNKNKT